MSLKNVECVFSVQVLLVVSACFSLGFEEKQSSRRSRNCDSVLLLDCTLKELKSVLRSDTTESKVSQRLTKRIDQLINQVDSLVEGLQKQKQSLAQEKTVAVDDLLRELAKLQQVAAKRGVEDPDRAKQEAKWERILQVVDYDHDGQISVKDAVKLVDMLRDEKLTSIGEKDVAEMVEALRQESELEQASPKIDLGQQQKKTV